MSSDVHDFILNIRMSRCYQGLWDELYVPLWQIISSWRLAISVSADCAIFTWPQSSTLIVNSFPDFSQTRFQTVVHCRSPIDVGAAISLASMKQQFISCVNCAFTWVPISENVRFNNKTRRFRSFLSKHAYCRWFLTQKSLKKFIKWLYRRRWKVC
jgi:hypothetical protein